MAQQQCTWHRNVQDDTINECVKEEHCAFCWYYYKVLTDGTVVHFLNACLVLHLPAILRLGRFVQLSEMLNKLEGNCQIVRHEHVSVHHISICFRGFGLANFQQDFNGLPNSMQKFTYIQQCCTFRINKVCFPITLHHITLY
jgi:hypothetical protein